MPADEVFRLSELNKYIEQVLSINFEDQIWIEAEINQIGESRGNLYIDLIEKNEDTDDLLATLPARIWRSRQGFIRKKIKAEIIDFLIPGMKVKFRGGIKYHAVYGISFQIDDVDLNFTIGALQRKKDVALRKLQDEGIFQINKTLEFPVVPQRIAVVSSRTAAGLADFIHQLQDNVHGIPFSIDIYHATVQGVNAASELQRALDEIAEYTSYYDVICIMRGGGSKLDLSAFDDEALCRKIASMPLVVLTAIGHETDTSLADLTAFNYVKTPTALADHLIESIAGFLSVLYDSYDRIVTSAKNIVHRQKYELQDLQHRAIQHAIHSISKNKQLLKQYLNSVQHSANKRILIEKQAIEVLKLKSQNADPNEILQRGFSLASQAGKIIKSAALIDTKKEITLLFHDGKVTR